MHDVVTTYHYAGDSICQTSLNLCHGVVVGYLSVLPHSLLFLTSDKSVSMTESRNAASPRNMGPPGRKEATLAGLPGPVSTQSQLCHYLLSTSRDFATEKSVLGERNEDTVLVPGVLAMIKQSKEGIR